METIRKKYNSNEIIVNTKSNFKSHLTKCQSIMNNNQHDKLLIKAMGKATFRAINLALQLNLNNYNTFDLKPRTYTVDILEDINGKKPLRGGDKDSFNPDDIRKKVTHIPAIEISVLKNQLEVKKLDKIKKEFKNQQNTRNN